MNLDRISLGALILALGLLVDDAIIAVEMMVVKMEEGYDRIKAATFAWSSTAFPMLTGTLVTAWLGFCRSASRSPEPESTPAASCWVVGIALVASWLVAVMFTPYLGCEVAARLRRTDAHHDPYHTRGLPDPAVGYYRVCVRHPRIVVVVTAALHSRRRFTA